jgi:hypothetical protein
MSVLQLIISVIVTNNILVMITSSLHVVLHIGTIHTCALGGGGGGLGAPFLGAPRPGAAPPPPPPPPPPRPFFPKLIGPPPGIFARLASEASKSQQIRARKICALNFETCRSSDVYNYIIFYIIIGHRSNKIQSLLDIDEFFSFFFKKTQQQNFLYIFGKINLIFFF